jgi:hypothetical protein
VYTVQLQERVWQEQPLLTILTRCWSYRKQWVYWSGSTWLWVFFPMFPRRNKKGKEGLYLIFDSGVPEKIEKFGWWEY